MADKPRGRGRPTLLTAELIEKIAREVSMGLPIELSAESNGVSRQTVLEWIRRGEGREDADRPADAADGLYSEFANRYRQARAAFAKALLQPCLEVIQGTRPSKRQKGPDGRPKLVKSLGSERRANEAHWHMSRRFPEFWGAGREQLVEDASAAADASKQAPVIQIVYPTNLDEDSEP